MHNYLENYIATKTAAAAARKAANTAIATEGSHVLPEACDKKAIHKAFTSLARSNKKAIAVVDGIDGATIYAEAEAKRIEKRKAKLIAESEALENAINSRLDAIMADDARRELLILEAQAAAEIAAQDTTEYARALEEFEAERKAKRDAMRQQISDAQARSVESAAATAGNEAATA